MDRETLPVIQIKIFKDELTKDIETKINEFMKDNLVVDVKMHEVNGGIQYTVVYQLIEEADND